MDLIFSVRGEFMMYKVTILFMALCAIALAQDFGLGPGSPLIPPYFTSSIESTAIAIPPPIVPFPVLALRPIDVITSFSYGVERLTPNPGCTQMVYFSVTAASVGMPGSAVNAEVAGNGAAGDIFVALVDPAGGPTVGPILWKDAPAVGLTPLPVQDEVSGASYPKLPATTNLVYFTLDAPSAAFYGLTAADIFYTAPGIVYAPFLLLGLVPADEIDALAIIDNGVVGALDPPDTVFVSLTPASPSAPLFGGPSAIAQVWPVFRPAYFSPQLGLIPPDDIDAITFFGPNGTPGCGPYVIGDANGDGLCRGSDVTRLVAYFKGLAIMSYQCYDVSHKAMLYSAGDVNGDCMLGGADVTTMVRYFKGLGSLTPCPWTPPCGI